RVFERIREQVRQDLTQPSLISAHGNPFRNLDAQLALDLSPLTWIQQRKSALQRLKQRDGCWKVAVTLLLQATHIEDVADQGHQTVAGTFGPIEIGAPLSGRERLIGQLQQLDEAVERHHWAAQLMIHMRDKLIFEFVKLACTLIG